ncbi:MAG: hypothetical protein KAU36_07955, partial [candidate division Zixibacteria bacterium]|nr:hypothetical protein [candidate division Zixibacteria bacterium]
MKRFQQYILIVLSFMIILNMISCGESDSTQLVQQRKKLAGELQDSRLYAAAIEEYQKILEIDNLDIKTRANINYLIGRIYFENLRDYEQAAGYYVRARALDPDAVFVNEASKNLVASLEKMGRVLSARRELDALTDIDAGPRTSGDVEVARIGNDPIWLSEVEAQIQSLPQQLQQQYVSRESRLEFMRQYVGMELIYRAASRENFGDDPEIKKQQQQLYRQLLIDKYLADKVIPEIKIDTLDVRNFYTANKDARYEGAPYDSVRTRVFVDYQNKKAQ